MPRSDETTFVLHGLDIDKRVVRAAVFIQKLRALVSALQTADEFANGRREHDYLIPKLETGSASVTVRERRRRVSRPRSPIAVLERAATAIYNGEGNADQLPLTLIDRVQKLGDGVAKRFSHAELAFSGNNVIRIDDFLLRQAQVAIEAITLPELQLPTYYRGLAVGTFDGLLKEIDARGTVLRGKLILSAGGLEIDCVMNKERVPEARESFDKRVIIEGAAHYDGLSQVPVRLDVRTIRPVDEAGADLLRWRGAFRPSRDDDIDEEW
jgi:hypothetical protein